MSQAKASFARKSSGLIRDATLFDAFVFGVSLAIPFAANFFLFPLYTYFLPGADWTIATVIGFVIAIANYVIYAGFGSMMPRSGGDYVFQSRGVHPILSFISVISWDVFLQAPLFAIILLSSSLALGITPLLLMAGTLQGNSALVDAGFWASSPTGAFAISAVLLFLALLANVLGIKWVARSQKYILLPLIIVSGITIPLLLFSTSPTAFHVAFDKYALALNGTPNTYATVLSATSAAGFVVPEFSWLNTIYLAIIIGMSFLAWTVWTAPIFGEIKGANSFKGLLVAFLAGGLFQAFFLMVPELAGFQYTLGTQFMNAIAFQAFNGTPALQFIPSLGLLTLMATDNLVVMVLASIGYIVAGYFMVQLFLTNMSRYLLAGSIDSVLPQWLSAPSRRFRSPVNALLISFIVALIFAGLVDLQPEQLEFWIVLAVLTAPVLFFGTSLAAIVFPKTNPDIYKSSPVARYKGVFSLCGIIMFLLSCFLLVGYFAVPELELPIGSVEIEVVTVFAVLAVVWYFAFKAYQAKKGIDVGLVYREIPPE